MESNIWVAVITVLHASLHLRMISFWICGTSCAGISTPISPLATIMPSATAMISSKLSIPSAFSILAMTLMAEPSESSIDLISRIQSAVRTKEAAIKSKPCLMPKRISSLSFSVSAGSLIFTLGTFTPFFSPNSPPLITVQTISVPSTFSTSSSIRPSSIRILFPAATSSFRPE